MGAYRLMGVLNVTPDSFSDGGLFLDASSAIAHGVDLAEQGAHILDIGGESTRPGANPVDEREELHRVVPVIAGLSEVLSSKPFAMQISIDTSKIPVAAEALSAGATLVNDVTALRLDPSMAGLIAATGADCCLMHMQGTPRTMQQSPTYSDVVSEVKAFLEERLSFAVSEGIAEERILLDPGIGFGKTTTHNLTLLRRLDELVTLGRPVVIGTSRKSFLGKIAQTVGAGDGDNRLPGTIATNVLALERGATVFRVHDVAPVAAALEVAAATLSTTCPPTGMTS
ncbi:MAG TPA: dihydropteroate synthase [Solirubrobacteraceae bacterium]